MLPRLSKGLGTEAQKPRYWGMTQGRSYLQGKQFFKVSIFLQLRDLVCFLQYYVCENVYVKLTYVKESVCETVRV